MEGLKNHEQFKICTNHAFAHKSQVDPHAWLLDEICYSKTATEKWFYMTDSLWAKGHIQ